MNELLNTNDYELIMLFQEDDELAKDILYSKYQHIINIIYKKYALIAEYLNIDLQELYSECSVGFTDALRCYKDAKKTSLATFITICIERRANSFILKYNRNKYKIIKDTLSLDTEYNGGKIIDVISDKGQNDPLNKILEDESYEELKNNIDSKLTKGEYEVYLLLRSGLNYQEIAKILKKSPKQIDNTIQRIKNKVRKLINN